MDFLPQMNAFTVFLAIAGVGFVFVLISLLFGEIFDHFDMGLITIWDTVARPSAPGR
jgi:hypothetical protein